MTWLPLHNHSSVYDISAGWPSPTFCYFHYWLIIFLSHSFVWITVQFILAYDTYPGWCVDSQNIQDVTRYKNFRLFSGFTMTGKLWEVRLVCSAVFDNLPDTSGELHPSCPKSKIKAMITVTGRQQLFRLFFLWDAAIVCHCLCVGFKMQGVVFGYKGNCKALVSLSRWA